MTNDEHKPHLVQRLIERSSPGKLSEGARRYFELDYMGAAEFERGRPTEAFGEASLLVNKGRETWLIDLLFGSPDIKVHYLGPASRRESAAKFLTTQLIEDGTERYSSGRPLKEPTLLRQSYLCLEERYQKICGWWCLDVDHQFALFKTERLANLFMSALADYDHRR